MSFPVLTTQRLVLRQIIATDLEKVFEGLSAPNVIKHYGVSFSSLEATKAQLKWYANLEATGKGIFWAICERESLQFYGVGGFNDLSQVHKKAEFGFWLLEEHWGKGFMQEAVPVMLEYAFQTLNLNRIEGYVETENQNCKKALRKLGFIHEGTMRNCEIKNDAFISVDIFSKLASDK